MLWQSYKTTTKRTTTLTLFGRAAIRRPSSNTLRTADDVFFFFLLVVVVVVVVSNFKSPSLMENNHWLHCQSGLEWGRTRQISDWALPSNINASFEIALKIHTQVRHAVPTAVARNCCNCLFVLFCFVFLILLVFPFWLCSSPLHRFPLKLQSVISHYHQTGACVTPVNRHQ
jgi:hypothetical protein